MKSQLPYIKCAITFLTTEEGGRKTPFSQGALSGGKYRPHIVIGNPGQRKAIMEDNRIIEEYIGVAFKQGPAQVEYGKEVTADLELMYYPHPVYDRLQSGTTFTVREGGHIVGYGKVAKKVNR